MLHNKALMVCQRYPIPENHGNPMRTMNFVRGIQTNNNYDCNVDIVYTNKDGDHQKSPLFNKEFVINPIITKKMFVKSFLRLHHQIPSPLYIFDKNAKKHFKNIVCTNNYDYIIFRYLQSIQLAFSLPTLFRKKIMVDIDDIPSENLYDMRFDSNSRISKVFSNLNRIVLKKYEKKCMHLGAAIFSSESDRFIFNTERNSSKLFVVPNIYSNESFNNYNFGDGSSTGNIILFVGALDYRPNTKGLKWFVKVIFNSFRTQYPDAKFLVVGRNPVETITQVCNANPGIELHANVEDLRPYYQQSRVVVVPLLSGGGTRIKIIEAAHSKRAVLATPVGASGLNLKNGKDIHLFENAEEFLDQYIKLSNHEYYSKTVDSANTVVTEKYSKKRFQDALLNVIRYINSKT